MENSLTSIKAIQEKQTEELVELQKLSLNTRINGKSFEIYISCFPL